MSETSAPGEIDLAIVFVTWNSVDDIAAAIQSVVDDLSTSGLRYELWLVDSASEDKTVDVVRDRFDCVNIIACAENIGFGAANNLALRQMGFDRHKAESRRPKAVYLLNPDTITRRGATKLLFDTLMAGDDVGVVGARLTYGDGSFQHSAFRFPGLRQIWSELFPTPGRLLEGGFNGRYPRSRYRDGEPFDVDFTLGATMMLKREVIEQSGLFDEAFFIYCEEIDWAWRIKKLGWRICCVPSAQVTHLGGQSTSQARPRSLINLWQSRLLLYDKHHPRWKRLLARQLVIRGMQRYIRSLDIADKELVDACRTIIDMAKS